MNCRFIIGIVLASVAAAWGADKSLRIYLPGEKTVESASPALGQVALLLGDETLVQKAERVGIGQFAAAGQELIVDRQTVLSCLASAGIKGGQVQFNGAESVCIRRHEKTITADRFEQAARGFLENRMAEQKVTLKLLRPARDHVLAGEASKIELKAHLSGAQSRGTQRVTVTILQDQTPIGHEEVVFAVQYERRRVVAAESLPVGAEVTADNTRVESYTSAMPEEDGMYLPYGMLTLKPIEAGQAIEPAGVQSKTMPVLIKRQQQVVLKIDTNVLLVSAYGEAMEDGKAGDLIRVRRGSRLTNDERFVVGRVMQDGTVQPLLH